MVEGVKQFYFILCLISISKTAGGDIYETISRIMLSFK